MVRGLFRAGRIAGFEHGASGSAVMGFDVQVVTAFQGIRELATLYVFEYRVARILHFGKAAVVCRYELV